MRWTDRKIFSVGIRCFLRYLDTKSNGESLRKCIFEGHIRHTSVLIAVVDSSYAENIPPVAAHEEAETLHQHGQQRKQTYFEAEKEAIF
ncbi:hypothetical protein Tco_1029224 [Tanacetum coccineum]|uniref:Uncharacterized protein n=1 Tax=Tanacetum coccineum TaxID=301880 RepID=A0ABQ5G4D6_9ASTR